MRNFAAIAVFAAFTSACAGDVEPKPTMCIVTKDGNGTVRRADLLSADAIPLQYGMNFTEMAGGSWQGSLYDAGTNAQLNVMITVDSKTCDTIENWGTTSTPIVDPAFRNN